MSEMETIYAATVAAAELLSQSALLGTIEVSKRGEIICAGRSTILDISELERVSTAIARG